MSRKANKTVVGIFVVVALALLIAGISVFGSGMLFKKTDKYVLFFDGSVKGLSAGAPVVFRGVKIGYVKEVDLLFDKDNRAIYIPVIIEVELSRVKGTPKGMGHPDYNRLIKDGLRAQLDMLSYVTGQLIVSFDFYPDTSVNLLGIIKDYPELPTIPMKPDIFQLTEKLPVKDIAENLKGTTAGLNKLVNSEGFRGMNDAIQEATLTARSVRLFLEYLEQHPEALLKGKSISKGGD